MDIFFFIVELNMLLFDIVVVFIVMGFLEGNVIYIFY